MRLVLTVAVLLAVAVIAGVHYAVAMPLWRTYALNTAEIARQARQIARYEGIAATLPVLRRQASILEERLRRGEHVLAGDSASFAAASLQERVKIMVRRGGGQLMSTQVLAPEVDGSFSRITIRAQLSVPTAALQEILYDLESGTPYLVVDRLTVTVRAMPAADSAFGQSAIRGTRANLQVQMDISGFLHNKPSDTVASSRSG